MWVGGYVPVAAFIAVIVTAAGVFAIVLAAIIAAISALTIVALAVFMFLVSCVSH